MHFGTRIILCFWFVFALPMSAAQPGEVKPHGKDFSSSLHSLSNAPAMALPEAYLLAVHNAVNATQQDASRDLTAILPSNRDLIWRGSDNDRQVLVATWTTHDSYFVSPGQPMGKPFVENYTVWVTAAPELKAFCRSYQPGPNGPPLVGRLEQLLGLPPRSGHRYVVELWVRPQDLFRPSADPEVTDREAQLDHPNVPGYLSVSDLYKQWFKDTAAARYQPKHGPPYPWTRLGYTYDWGNPDGRMGLSEFVIREGAELTVHAVHATEDYGTSK
jgi:hypothetical protein